MAKYCPKCGSAKIKWVLPQIWSVYSCGECGYRGPLVIEDDKLAARIEERYSKLRKK